MHGCREAGLSPGTLAMLGYALIILKHKPPPPFQDAFLAASSACMQAAQPRVRASFFPPCAPWYIWLGCFDLELCEHAVLGPFWVSGV